MTVDELKVVISADDSKFSKAINRVKSSLKGVASVNVGKGLDKSNASVDKFRSNYLRAMKDFEKSTNKSSKAVRDAWIRQLDFIIQKTETKLEYLSKQFAQTGYADSWGVQIDETDAYFRKLKEFQKLVSDGVVDVDTGDLDKIPQIVDEATASIESMDARIQATINIEGVDDLKDTDRIILLIKDALNEIEKLKVEPVTKETLAIIKQYRKEIDTLVGQWGRLNKYTSRNLSYSAFQVEHPNLYNQIKDTANIKETKSTDRNQPNWGKMTGTITRALIGVRSLFFFVRKIAMQNEYLQFAVGAMFETIAGALKPVLDFIANILIGLAKVIGRIFGVAVGVSGSASATAGNTEKMLTIASFDELETLNKAMEGGSGDGGVDGGYDSLLKKIDEKLGWIYKIIDKLKGTIQKADLPNEDDKVEGVIASGAAGSQSPSGISFSWGTNKDNEAIEGVYEAWEDAKIDWLLKQWQKIKDGWKSVKENFVLYNEQMVENTIAETDAQIETWERFKESVKSKWQNFKDTYRQVNEQMAQQQMEQTDLQIQRWQNFKQKMSDIWTSIKEGFANTWTHITDGVKQAVDKAKTLIGTIADKVGELAGNAWGKVKGFGNTIIQGVEDAINNIVWSINNSGFLTGFNRLFNTNVWLGYVNIPRLANGGVLTTPTVAQLGEYPGANSNPEIAAPQSILKETMDASNSELAGVFVQVGRQIIEAIAQKDLEVQIGDTTIAKSAARGNRQYQLATGQSLF